MTREAVTHVSSPTWHDDDHLFASLKEALREAEAVPPRFVDAGKTAFAWHNVDAELADLTYDSSTAHAEPVGAMRAEDASLRALTYATADLTIEIEITTDAVLCQILPPQAGTVSIYLTARQGTESPVDEMGFFAIRPVPTAPFRLRCLTRSGIDVMTGLITP
jgi:hypothetical protein